MGVRYNSNRTTKKAVKPSSHSTGARRDGLTASNVDTRKGTATVLAHGSGSEGKSWISLKPSSHSTQR